MKNITENEQYKSIEAQLRDLFEPKTRKECNLLVQKIDEYCNSKCSSNKKGKIAVDIINYYLPENIFSDLNINDHVMIQLVKSLVLAIDSQGKNSKIIKHIIPSIVEKRPDILNIGDSNNNTILKAAFEKKLYALMYSCLQIAKKAQLCIDLHSNGCIEMVNKLIENTVGGNDVQKNVYKELLQLCAASPKIDQAKLKSVEQLCIEHIFNTLKIRLTIHKSISLETNNEKLEWLINTMKSLSLTWSDVDSKVKLDILNIIMALNVTRYAEDHYKISSILVEHIGITDTISRRYYDDLLSTLDKHTKIRRQKDLDTNKNQIKNLLCAIKGLSLIEEISKYIDSGIVDRLESIIIDKNKSLTHCTESDIIEALKKGAQTENHALKKQPHILDITIAEESVLEKKITESTHIKRRLYAEEPNDGKRLKTDDSLVPVNEGKSEEKLVLEQEIMLLLGLNQELD